MTHAFAANDPARRRRGDRRLQVMALLGLLALPATASAERVQLSVADALGEPVSFGMPQQRRPAILFFMSKRCKDASAAFARAVDEKILNGPVDAVGIVDVTRYDGLFRGLASRALRKSAEEGRERRRARRVAAGVDASPAFVNRWHLIGDFDGSLFDRFQMEPDPARPTALIVDSSGQLYGPYFDAAAVVDAVGKLLPPHAR